MSERISYSDEEDFPGQFFLWQANCERSLGGRLGQAALRELEAALVALPTKRLIANDLQTPEGDVCAIGALARHKGITPSPEGNVRGFDPEYEMEEIGVECGMPRMVAWKAVEKNDIELGYVTPEERYTRMLDWVRSELSSRSPTGTGK